MPISQGSKAARIPTPKLVSEGSFTAATNTTAEQTVLSISSAVGLLNSVSAVAGAAGTTCTIRVKVDGVTVYSVTQSTNAALADLLADAGILRRAFPNGVAFRSSLAITIQAASTGVSLPVVSYHAVTVDSLP